MRSHHGKLLASVVALALLTLAPPHQATGTDAARHAEKLPVGTALVVYDTLHDRTYFATDKAVQERRTGARFPPGGHTFAALPGFYAHDTPDTLQISADGRRLIVRFAYDSFVLDTAGLRPLRRLDTPYAWWEGSRLGYLDWDKTDHARIYVGGSESRVYTGRTRIYAADSSGRYFLGARQVSRDYKQQLQLWGRKGRSLTLLRSLTTVFFDPGSSGVPSHWEVASSGRVALFGEPIGGATGDDYLCVLQARRVTTGLKDRKANAVVLEWGQKPLVAEEAIVGLARTSARGLELTNDRYWYRITPTSIALTPVSSNVAFVTYDRKRGIGFGVADKHGVTVEWHGTRGAACHAQTRCRIIASYPIPPLLGQSASAGPIAPQAAFSLVGVLPWRAARLREKGFRSSCARLRRSAMARRGPSPLGIAGALSASGRFSRLPE